VSALSGAATLLLALATSLLASACVSRSYPEKRQYVIEVDRPVLPPVEAVGGRAHGIAPASVGTLRVGRIQTSALYERKGFVYRTGEATWERDFYNEFFAPPGAVVRQATLRWMERSPLFSGLIGRHDPVNSDWILEGKIEALYADVRDPDGTRAVMEIRFSVLDASATRYAIAFNRKYAVAANADGRSADAMVSAWRECLTRILTELEADLRESLAS
jgi:cholesterol transport system auxiliary component